MPNFTDLYKPEFANSIRDALPLATQTENGLLSKEDKKKLDDGVAGTPLATNNPLPLGATAAVGTGTTAARDDHIHIFPSKADIGLGNVDNTSDADKPVSTLVQSALNSKADLVGGKVPVEQLPVEEIAQTWTVTNEADLVTLTNAHPGDIARVTGTNPVQAYILTAMPPTTLSNWLNITNEGGVISVNGKTGVVTLNLSEITGSFALSSTAPAALGTAAVGVANTAARADHVHPIPAGTNFTTDEVATAETFVDGKVIYKKTISFGALPNATTKSVSHSISGMAYLVKLEGAARSGSTFLPLPFAGAYVDNEFNVRIQVTTSQIQILTSNNLSAYSTCYITLYYVK